VACAAVTAAVLALAMAGCGSRPAVGARGPVRAVLTTTFGLSGVLGLATGDGVAWVTTGNAVLRIDPRTDQARQVLSEPGASLTGIAFGAGSLWVEGAVGLLRVNLVTGKVTARIGVHAALLLLSAYLSGHGSMINGKRSFVTATRPAARLSGSRSHPGQYACRTPSASGRRRPDAGFVAAITERD
jgi:hypothetical protein